MKKIVPVALVVFSSTAFCYDTISSEQINMLRSVPNTNVSYVRENYRIQEVPFAVGNCAVVKDNASGQWAAQFSVAKCVQVGSRSLVTINPKGLFNEKIYIVAGSEKLEGYERVIDPVTTSRDYAGAIGAASTSRAAMMMGDLVSANMETACKSVEKSYQEIHFSEQDKVLLNHCIDSP